jgi:hypothetical protein
LGSVHSRSAAAGIHVFDLTSTESFRNLEMWTALFLDVAGSKALIMVFGNETALVGAIAVTERE